jgi:AraC-like DNA-binding protein
VGENMKNYWQYHPEYEIMYIKRSSGTCMIGDYIGNFRSGDIIFLGPNIPHSLRHDPKYVSKRNSNIGEAVIVLFQKDVLGNSFLHLPEAKGIRDTLSLAGRGLKVIGKAKNSISRIMDEMLLCGPGRKLLSLLDVLLTISEQGQYEILSSNGFIYTPTEIDNNRINSIFEYTFSNYENNITIEDIADLVNMTRYSFCRYFKGITKKTYIQFLTEVRIGKACRLLIEENKNVTEVCYSCGYQSVSHFNHQFKTIKFMSPLEYKRKYMKYITILLCLFFI